MKSGSMSIDVEDDTNLVHITAQYIFLCCSEMVGLTEFHTACSSMQECGCGCLSCIVECILIPTDIYFTRLGEHYWGVLHVNFLSWTKRRRLANFFTALEMVDIRGIFVGQSVCHRQRVEIAVYCEVLRK